MRKSKKITLQEETMQPLNRLSQASLADIRGGDGNEPSPDDDNDARAQIIEVG